MPRTLWLLPAALGLLCATAGSGHAKFLTRLGAGAYGGVNIPVVQDDAATGPLYGLRARLGFPGFTFEPAVTFLENQDEESDIEGIDFTLEAPEVTSFSFSALIGGSFYGVGGIGWSTVEVPNGTGESSEPTYFVGAGAEIPAGPIAVDVSPRLFIIHTAEGASRKNVGVLVGVHYYFF